MHNTEDGVDGCDAGDDGGGVVEWGMCVGGWVVYFVCFVNEASLT